MMAFIRTGDIREKEKADSWLVTTRVVEANLQWPQSDWLDEIEDEIEVEAPFCGFYGPEMNFRATEAVRLALDEAERIEQRSKVQPHEKNSYCSCVSGKSAHFLQT